MLRPEQLQQKRDDLVTLLRSRKRKLSALYAVTATDCPDVNLPPQQNPDYHKTERAFFDANDLEKGRLFDESTLPPRPRLTRQQLRNQTNKTSENSTKLIKKPHPTLDSWISQVGPGRVDQRSGDGPDSGLSGESKGKSAADHPQDEALEGNHHLGLTNDDPDELDSPRRPPEDAEPVEDLPHRDGSRPQEKGDKGKDDNASRRGSRRNSPRLKPPLADRPESRASSVQREGKRAGSPVNHPIPPRLGTTAAETRRERSPLVLTPVTAAADPQSSPASTNGPVSSNTPDPTPASPTTSPGDEEPPKNSASFDVAKTDGGPGAHVDERQTEQGSFPADDHPTDLPDVDNDIDMLEDLPMPTESHQPPSPVPDSTAPATASSSRKPPMRIDTKTGTAFMLDSKNSGSIVESPIPMTASATPRRTPMSAPITQSPHRRETRIASGAMERRSVSEILGETPKSSPPQINKSAADSPVSAATRESFETASAQGRLADRERREKERSKLSTVVFAKPQPADQPEPNELLRQVVGEALTTSPKPRDYLHTLFESKAYCPPRSVPLTMLLASAHKSVSTADHLIDYQEQMNCRTLKRIYQLQNANRWPLRQMQRAAEPPRSTSHWDFLLDHAKWMRTDFREERKWKLAAARGVAEWCAEWVAGSADEKLDLQVKIRPPRFLPLNASHMSHEDVTMEDQPAPAVSTQATPDLVASAEADSVSDGGLEDPVDGRALNAPAAAIFSLGQAEFIFPMSKTPAADKLLNELPLYQPAIAAPDASKSDLAERRDAAWRTDILPISRFATGKIRFQDPKPPSKRSRFDYETEPALSHDSIPLPPEKTDVALFMPENKPIRDRIHPGHSFRPPSEYPMPSQAFFESRSSSQWAQAEDDELRRLVKEYSYNWSLISSCLSPRSTFVSGADRRTPWECFERWIGLEGLPADMSKTPYFRAYHSRIEAAGRHVIAQQEAAQRSAGNSIQVTPKKRTTQPVRVDRKRNQRHLAMLDAMRKLAKKRETALQKQQHAADLAAMRKVNEANQPKPPITKPAEFSRLKHEREIKMAERAEIYRQQLAAHQKAAQQRTQMIQANGVPNAAPRPGAQSSTPTAGSAMMPVGMSGSVGGMPPQRPHPSMQGLPNGLHPNGPMPANVMARFPPAQAQVQLQAADGSMLRYSPEQIRMIKEANALAAQQRAAILANQAQQGIQQNGPHSSPNMAVASMANTNGNNGAGMIPGYGMVNGVPTATGPINNNAGSPRMNGQSMMQSANSQFLPAITSLMNTIRSQHPEMSDQDVNRRAMQQLTQMQKQPMQPHGSPNQQHAQVSHAQQIALQAAAGGYPMPVGYMSNDVVQKFHQERQRLALMQSMAGPMGGPGMGMPGMIGPVMTSPVLNLARPASQHTSQGQLSRSATPREQRSGSNGMNGGQGSPMAAAAQGMQT